jgi:HEAT repeat protein
MTSSTDTTDFRNALRRLGAAASDADADVLRRLAALPDGEARRAFAEAFLEGEPQLPTSLARALAGRVDARVVSLLLPLLRDESPRVRNAARSILERVGAEAPGPLLDFSRDPDARMRVFATCILGCVPSAAPRLIDMLSDPDPTVVDCAVAALGALRAEAAVEPLADLLRRSRSWIRLSALDALMRVGTPPAVRAILSALPDADPETRAILVSVLERLAAESTPDLAADIRAGLGRTSP